MKRVVIDALKMLQHCFGISLIGYVIMPEHLHIILYPHAKTCDVPIPVSRLLHRFKQYIGFYGKEILRGIWRQQGGLWSDALNEWATNRLEPKQLMETRGYDFNIDRHDTLLEKLTYCHKNPVTRGLVTRAEDWKWSSYCYYELNDRSVLAMDWDGSWPIRW